MKPVGRAGRRNRPLASGAELVTMLRLGPEQGDTWVADAPVGVAWTPVRYGWVVPTT